MSGKVTIRQAAAIMGRKGGRIGGKAKTPAKSEAARKNGRGGGRKGYPCIIEYRVRVESAWLEVLDENARPTVYPSKLAAGIAIAAMKRDLEGDSFEPEREFRVTRVAKA